MKIYLEIIEVGADKKEVSPMLIREEVKNKSEALSKFNTKHKSKYSDKKFIKRIHKHYHDPGDRRACVVEELKIQAQPIGGLSEGRY